MITKQHLLVFVFSPQVRHLETLLVQQSMLKTLSIQLANVRDISRNEDAAGCVSM